MAVKTAGVQALVGDALDTVPKPYTEDVIDDVFLAIESRPELLARYEAECDRLRKWVVNNSVGYWTANLMHRRGEVEVPARKSTLIGQYSKLDQPAPKGGKPLTLTEAAELMSDHFQKNRTALPPWIRECRVAILEFLMAGAAVEQAYAKALACGNPGPQKKK